MKPDRSNYEIWIIDWLDGRLDEARSGGLMEFLEENPDLKEEFDSLAVTRLAPGEFSFSQKEKLTRSASELPVSQIEFLSVACLEKDITPKQLSDLEINISRNPENKRIFDTLQRTKLLPPRVEFKNKNLLKKYPAGNRILRISLAGMSAAATIAILLLGYFFVRHSKVENEISSAEIVIPDSSRREPFVVKTTVLYARAEKSVAERGQNELSGYPVAKTIVNDTVFSIQPQADADPLPNTVIYNTPVISGVALLPPAALGNFQAANALIASNNNFITPVFDEDRSRFSKFIARTFREKLLKDDSYNETPLKTYEIAEAGIEGLNKLFGWEMALVKTNDDDGNLKSIYFSSKVLKFNAPVKKQELSR